MGGEGGGGLKPKPTPGELSGESWGGGGGGGLKPKPTPGEFSGESWVGVGRGLKTQAHPNSDDIARGIAMISLGSWCVSDTIAFFFHNWRKKKIDTIAMCVFSIPCANGI